MNSEKFQLGAGNAKGVYDLTNPDRGEGVPQKELWERRTKDEFMPNAAARVEATLRLNGYRQIVDLGNGVRYPSVDEWIASKIGSNEGWTRTYPAFIQDEESNEIFFCKSRIKPLIKMIGGGFLAEKDILTSVPNLPAPRLIRYIPENNASGELETLIFEASWLPTRTLPYGKDQRNLPRERTIYRARVSARGCLAQKYHCGDRGRSTYSIRRLGTSGGGIPRTRYRSTLA